MKIICKVLLALLILFGNSLHSQNETETDLSNNQSFKHSLGFGAGYTTGNGLSYRFYHNLFGVQLNFAPIIDEDKKYFSSGLSFIYKISETDNLVFFAYQGNHYLYDKSVRYNYDSYGDIIKTEHVNQHYNMGVGIGIDFIIAERICLSVMGGYAAYRNFTKTSLTGEIGLYYRF